MTEKTKYTLEDFLIAALNKIDELTPKLQESLIKAQQSFEKFIDENPNALENIHKTIEYFQNLPNEYRNAWSLAAKNGWYPNGESAAYINSIVKSDQTTLDIFMINDIEANWDKTTSDIIEYYPERKHILECAFELHKNGNYIASIPLILTQVDGICNQVLKAHFFSEKDKRSEIITSLSKNTDNLLDIYLSLFILPTQFSAGIREKSINKKTLAPNRNGILHGSRHHLDYASKINSLKAYSLLAFITFVSVRRRQVLICDDFCLG